MPSLKHDNYKNGVFMRIKERFSAYLKRDDSFLAIDNIGEKSSINSRNVLIEDFNSD